jgi:multidrug efflux pump subunit AcrA (membrane-fusion protein)
MSGISLEHLRVAVAVPQSIITQVREQQRARVQLPDGQWIDAGKITVFPVADNGSGSFRTRLELPPGQSGLFPGMVVRTAFVTGRETLLAIPASALVYRSEVSGIYVQDDGGNIRFRHVRPGRKLENGQIAILTGLEPGELVAIDPASAVMALKSAADTTDE